MATLLATDSELSARLSTKIKNEDFLNTHLNTHITIKEKIVPSEQPPLNFDHNKKYNGRDPSGRRIVTADSLLQKSTDLVGTSQQEEEIRKTIQEQYQSIKEKRLRM